METGGSLKSHLIALFVILTKASFSWDWCGVPLPASGFWLGGNQPVYISSAETPLLFSRKQRWISKHRGLGGFLKACTKEKSHQHREANSRPLDCNPSLSSTENIGSLFYLLYSSHCLSMVGLWPSFCVHSFCGVMEGRLTHSLPRWLRTDWQSMISRGKISWNTQPRPGIEPGACRRLIWYIHSPTELAWSDSFAVGGSQYQRERRGNLRQVIGSSWTRRHVSENPNRRPSAVS